MADEAAQTNDLGEGLVAGIGAVPGESGVLPFYRLPRAPSQDVVFVVRDGTPLRHDATESSGTVILEMARPASVGDRCAASVVVPRPIGAADQPIARRVGQCSALR